MSGFVQAKSSNPKLGQKQKARQVGYSASRIKRYKVQKSVSSPYTRRKSKTKESFQEPSENLTHVKRGNCGKENRTFSSKN